MEEDEEGPYHLLQDGDTISSDDHTRLKQLGYKQELSRDLSALANFSVTFSIVSVLTGLNTAFDIGITYGGPVTMVYGWPIVGLFTLLVGLSMAEICSAYPTSGGLYFWSAKLCGNRWGPLASWLTGWYVLYVDSLAQNINQVKGHLNQVLLTIREPNYSAPFWSRTKR